MKSLPPERLRALLRPTLTREVGLVIVLQTVVSLALVAFALRAALPEGGWRLVVSDRGTGMVIDIPGKPEGGKSVA